MTTMLGLREGFGSPIHWLLMLVVGGGMVVLVLVLLRLALRSGGGGGGGNSYVHEELRRQREDIVRLQAELDALKRSSRPDNRDGGEGLG